MGNYLHSMGLDFLTEEEDTIRGVIGDTVRNGKVIYGYYHRPYINNHYGPVQIVARLGPGEKEDEMSIKGFDTHCDSIVCWKMRILQKREPKNKEDVIDTRILARSPDGNNILHIDVINGDILPSFKEDEIIELQMMAFSAQAEFYPNEEAYEESAPADENGKKFLIGMNTLFPTGIFTKKKELLDIVQIVGEIKKMQIGKCVFGEEEIRSFVIFHLDTQMGPVVVAYPTELLDQMENTENVAVGKVMNCFARLSGDAAIYQYENGIVKDAENNLKLVAYTLEDGDPERLRSVLAENFTYHSDSSGKDISNIDEYIEFAKMVRQKAKPTHTEYATITGITEGEGELKYPVGTRCAVIQYEGEENYDALIFVDTDEGGNIERILLSREGRYRFRVDEPLPSPENKYAEAVANQTWQEAIVIRAHFHQLLDREKNLESVGNTIQENEGIIRAALSDLFDAEISEETFAKAFVRGIEKSGAEEFNEKRLMELGRQFHKDFTLRLSDEEQREKLEEALILTCAVGLMYNRD